jgi:putative NADH-flavin reductase
MSKTTVAVLGAGGKTGQECVKEIISKGYDVK